MSVPETGSVQSAESADSEQSAESTEPRATDQASPWDDPRLPWSGKPRTADILCWLGIVLSGLFYWVLLPFRVRLVGTHPVWSELMNGSTESIISAAAFAKTGHGTVAVALLAAIPGLMKFDWLYWWAGRLWGERLIVMLPGGQRVEKNMARIQRAGRKITWPAVVISYFLPIPSAIIYVVAGWAGMRLVTFLVLDLIGALLWAGLLVGLGEALGQHGVVVAKTVSHYSLWFTIGFVVLSVFFVVRSQRRMAGVAAAARASAEEARTEEDAG
jgi:membrane protein DedA with SNARE-associated domain